MIKIDGSYLEGGGQILRTAVSLAAVTNQPCKIINIRKGRPIPGLKPQHLNSIRAVSKICDGNLRGDRIKSEKIEFYPNKIQNGFHKIDIGTAGSIGLVLQTLVPVCIRAERPVKLEIIGGTDVKWSPNMEYFQEVFCRNIKRMGIEIESEVVRYGFYPKGGGIVKITINPCKEIGLLDLIERGKIKRYDIRSIVSKGLEKAKVAERQIEGAKKIIEKFNCEYFKYDHTLSPGSSVHIHTHCDNCELGVTVLGEKGKPAEKVGEECAKELEKQLRTHASLDRWMADQILPYMALAGSGKVTVAEITKHCLTNIWTIEKFLPVRFRIEGKQGKPGVISIT